MVAEHAQIYPDNVHRIIPRLAVYLPLSKQDVADRWGWDHRHAKMPCCPKNRISKNSGHSKWQMIERKFCEQIPPTILTSYEVEAAILAYNSRHKWKFEALHEFSTENRILYHRVVPKLLHMALSLPHVINRPLPLLRRGVGNSLSLTQVQIAAILANAFLCAFPERNLPECSRYPSINFNALLRENTPGNVDKLHFLFNYFDMAFDKNSVDVVSFTRRHMVDKDLPNWKKSRLHLSDFLATSEGLVEDQEDMLMVNFSTKMIGGGVLDSGSLQQDEVVFMTNPELLAARLFTEELQKNEALLVIGSQYYSDHGDAGDHFKYLAAYKDETAHDRWRRRESACVFLDAAEYADAYSQYDEKRIRRELNKAFIGMHSIDRLTRTAAGVATGNWGCGELNGDPQLKLLLQLMAASQAHRPLLRYFTDGDDELTVESTTLHSLLINKDIRVGELYNMIEKYVKVVNKTGRCKPSLFVYILHLLK